MAFELAIAEEQEAAKALLGLLPPTHNHRDGDRIIAVFCSKDECEECKHD